MSSVCTVVVTYNRYSLLSECLDALFAQSYSTDIVVVDNASSDNTPARLKSDGYLDHHPLHLLTLKHNLGGAGGFYEGIKFAKERGYDFLWLMDDDAEPAHDALELLLLHVSPAYSAYAPTLYSGTREEHIIQIAGHRGYFDFDTPLPMLQKPIDANLYRQESVEIDMASFVGILIPMEHIKRIGLPKKEFFIHYDDTEYSLRLRKFGKILMVGESKIYHKDRRQDEKYIKKILWFKKPRVRFDKLWIKYYGVRNSVYLALRYGRNRPKIYLILIRGYLLLLKDIIMYDDNKLKRIHFATSSYLDGITGLFDNEKPKKILGIR